ncbi:MAG: amino acid adenylation domain-containing protein, partial [Bacteroidota bacterium]
FEMLVEKLQIERDLSQNPLFQIMFQVVAKNTPSNKGDDGLPTISMGSAKFDLTVSFEDYLDGLVGLIEYNTDLFEAATIDRIIALFQYLTHQLIEQPERAIRELSLVSETEEQRLIHDYNATATDYPAQSNLAELFRQQARIHPDKMAGKYGAVELSYRELDERSNQLARLLRDQYGVRRETIVGIYLDRSAELLVAILGIIKAGACYLPLDLDYPTERLSLMLEDTRARLVLTQPQFRSQLETNSVLLVDYSFDQLAHQGLSTQPLDWPHHPDQAAYVMYTSGSTGRPKGITITHRGIIRLVRQTNYLDLQSTDVLAQASNTSFDASTFEIWGALLHGATLVGIDKTTSINPKAYFKTIEAENINTIFVTTALLNQFGKQAPWAFRSVDKVLFGGEAATAKWVREVLQNSAPRELLNLYGPTESTTFATWFSVARLDKQDTVVPIGRAVANTRVYVLDEHLRAVPVGVPGELYIGGDGLARAYLGQPGMTAAHFLPDPYSPVPGARMYRTKDLVKWNEAGQLVFVGRIDKQVKLRGFRIELGEIESHLDRIAGVNESIVQLRTLKNGQAYLVAYLEVAESERPSPESIKTQLKKHLPEYMIPAALVLLDRFPHSPNGKIDRKKLPEPEMAKSERSRATSTVALTQNQRVISEIWKEVLGLESLGIHDNFFDIGGHSLMIALVNNRLQEELHREIPIIDLFQYPTIHSLATRLEATTETVSMAEPKGLSHIRERATNRKLALQRKRRSHRKPR